MTNDEEYERLMTTAEISTLFRVHPKTVSRWANAGKLTSLRTLGNRRRYLQDEVMALYHAGRTGRRGLPPKKGT